MTKIIDDDDFLTAIGLELTNSHHKKLRDQFAMAALASIENRTPPDFVAKRVYAIADAMLAERNK